MEFSPKISSYSMHYTELLFAFQHIFCFFPKYTKEPFVFVKNNVNRFIYEANIDGARMGAVSRLQILQQANAPTAQ